MKINHLISSAAIVLTSFAGAGLAAADSSNSVFVSKTNCHNAGPGTRDKPFCTIQEGVDAAAAGGTVRVDKGTYPENVTVSKSLTLAGPDGRGSRAAIVTGSGGTPTFLLSADNIRLMDFTISGNTGGPGVQTAAANSGFGITGNTLTGNVFGLYLGSNGTKRSDVSHNVFDTNTAAGSASGNGIYEDQGASNVDIDHNAFRGQTNADITILANAAGPNKNLKVDHNTATGTAPLLILVGSQNVRFDHNSGSGFNNDQSGVFLGGSDSDVQISHNSLRGNVANDGTKGAASGVRINVDQGTFGVPGVTLVANTNVTVDHNSIRNFGDAGISIGNSTTPSMSTLTSSAIEHNTVRNNGNGEPTFDGGIFVRTGNTGLTFNHNTMRGNVFFDAQDDSHGTGTAGTDNIWDHNNCKTSQPNGLCHQ